MKTIFRAVCMMLAVGLLVGCTPAPQAPAAADWTPVTVTDQAGRSVTIAAQPQRIVSGYYISSSLLIALGQQQKLVGIEAKADKRPIYRLSAPALLELPNVGSAKEFDLEGCIALTPDLVILPLKLKNAVSTLEELGASVLLVNPENQALLEEMIALLGEATGSKAQADSLLSFLHTQQDRLSKALDGVEMPEVYFSSNSDLLSVAGSKMYQSDLLRLAGGSNAAQALEDSYWSPVDYEQLLAWDPDWIVLPSDAGFSVDDVLSDDALADCTAIQNGNVCQIPGDIEAWDSPVPGGVLGTIWLASVLHPERVDAAQCREIVQEFYRQFYGIEPTDEVYLSIF